MEPMKESVKLNTGTNKIAQFIHSTHESQIPKEVMDYAKKAMLDYIGVCLAGSEESCTRIIAQYVREQKSAEDANVIAQGFKTSAELAALANGTEAHALDYDDTIASSVHYNLHPSCPIFSAVFPVAEKHNMSGRELLTAYIVGLEVQYRVGLAIGQAIAPSGWHSTAILGTIGSVAAVSNLLRLDIRQIIMALGIAGSLTGGMAANLDTMTKPMHAGNAARSGIIAAMLARNGYGANDAILDGQFNFCQMFSGGKIKEIGDAVDNLSEQWDIVTRGLTFKPYPCCRANHACIDAILHIKEHDKPDLGQIESIVCKTHPIIPIFASRHKPKTGYEGKFSVEYCIATALLNGKVQLEDFTDENVIDTKRIAIGEKVSFVHPSGWGIGTVDLKAEVLVRLENGHVFSNLVNFPKGEPENPMSDEEFINKFKDCAGIMLGQRECEKAIDLITNFDRIIKVSDLLNLLKK